MAVAVSGSLALVMCPLVLNNGGGLLATKLGGHETEAISMVHDREYL